jgi:hypothetical protein
LADLFDENKTVRVTKTNIVILLYFFFSDINLRFFADLGYRRSGSEFFQYEFVAVYNCILRIFHFFTIKFCHIDMIDRCIAVHEYILVRESNKAVREKFTCQHSKTYYNMLEI